MSTLGIQELTARLARLEKAVGALNDERNIRDVLAQYGYNADLGREEAWVDLWSEDGTYDLDFGRFTGRDALLDIVMDREGAHKREIENRSQHVIVNPMIRIVGDTAWCECYSIVLVGTESDGYAVYTGGYNHFDLQRSGQTWTISRRLRRSVGGPVWGGDVIAAYLTVT
jgi:hypothetical protein